MNEIPLDLLYDINDRKLVIEPEFDKRRRQDTYLRCWASEGGMSDGFRSPGRERMLAEKKKLEVEIEGMYVNMQDIFRNIQRKELVLQEQACTLAPIRLIPPEILRRILVALDISLPGDKLILIRLMLVCKLWAETIHDMPEMWTKIVISRFTDNRCQWLVRHLAKWKTAPLDLEYDDHIKGDALFEHLLTRASTWRSFRFHPAPFISVKGNQLVRIWEALRQATTLTELSLVDDGQIIIFTWNNSSDQSPISLPSLKTLRLFSCTGWPCFLMLPSLTNLKYDNVWMTADHFYGWAEMTRNLRCLYINNLHLVEPHGSSDFDWQSLMNSPMQFPFLEKLVVDAPGYSEGIPKHPLYVAIMAGSPHLTSLLLTTSAGEQLENLEERLREFKVPQIKTLTLHVNTVRSQWGRTNLNIYLRVFCGVEDLVIDGSRDTEEATIKVLNAISNPGPQESAALPPWIRTLSFHDLVDGWLSPNVVDELRYLAQVMMEDRMNPCQCRFSIQTRGKVLIRDASVVQAADFLRTYECNGQEKVPS